MRRLLARTALLALLPAALAAQAPAAAPADVASEEAIIAALYDVISGPAGPRDWDRFRTLFVPGARLIPTGPRETGEVGARVLTPDEYVERVREYFGREPFFETELAHRSQRYGPMVHRFSTYESRRAPGEAPFARGINSIQLLDDGRRWWVVTVYWAQERPDLPLPPAYQTSD